MAQLSIESTKNAAIWHQATTLAERLNPKATNLTNPDFDATAATKRLQRWRSQASLDNDLLFERRLALDNLTEAEFLQLLGEPPETLQQRFPETPDWLLTLDAALNQPFSAEEGQLPLSTKLNPRLEGFLEPIRPLIAQARRELQSKLASLSQTYAQLAFEPNSIENLLLEGLAEQLIERLSHTLVTEMQVAKWHKRLSGETSEERFDSFIGLLGQPAFALSLLQEYSVLTRQIIITLQNWVNFRLEFLQHLCADWLELVARLSPKANPGQLKKISANQGDGHRNGRSVLILEFSSGLKLTYKPRSLAADLHFQELLEWLNQKGAQPPFRPLQILDRGTYGWMEFVAPAPCTTEDEVRRFYQRQGNYLAIFYALCATDLHYENLVAVGEHPVFIDLETLFHPNISQGDQVDLATEAMSHSVLQTGLLPLRVWTSKDSAGLEVSGLGGEEGQLSPQPVPRWEEVGTDRMRLVYKQVPMGQSKHRPTLNGLKVSPLPYVEHLVAGFRNLYELLLAQREELLVEDGWLARFGQDPVRVVVRATQLYHLMLEKSLHPDRLRNALERDRLFDKLWFEVKERSFLVKLIAAERYDLHQGDFPIFTARPASTTLWTSQNEPIENLLSAPPLVRAERRLQEMGETDLARQLWFIQASLAILASENENHSSSIYTAPEEQAHSAVSREQLLAGARAVGDRLEELALWRGDEAAWVGLSLENLTSWYLAPLNLTLYDGVPGIALLLAYLGQTTGEARYTTLAKAALLNLQRQLASEKNMLKAAGGYAGWGGVIYTLTHLAALWDEPALLDQAESLVKLLPPLIEQDTFLDFITGTAGCVGSLISLYLQRPSEATLAVLLKCGDYLVAKAEPQAQGVAWRTFMSVSQPAVGLGRGSTGMGWALLQLAALTGNSQFEETGKAALLYERSVFSPSENNWPDFRLAGKEALPPGVFRFMSAWCHGAPGIGLARLSLMDHYSDPELRLEVEAAVKNTVDKGFSPNHSLCHGDLGNLELLLAASRKFQDTTLAGEVERWAATILAGIEQKGWLCSNPVHIETPGLMVGLAGIRYGLLRMADPKRVPSVLILEPPR